MINKYMEVIYLYSCRRIACYKETKIVLDPKDALSPQCHIENL